MTDLRIRTTVVSLPVRDPEVTLAFYKNALGFSDAQFEEGIIALELPNLSLFLIEKGVFETYSKIAGREARLPNGDAGIVISCAMETKEAVDAILEHAREHGGAVLNEAAMNEMSGGYIGYFTDPDGHLWELVFSQPKP